MDGPLQPVITFRMCNGILLVKILTYLQKLLCVVLCNELSSERMNQSALIVNMDYYTYTTL